MEEQQEIRIRSRLAEIRRESVRKRCRLGIDLGGRRGWERQQ
jgi:hypothetical protein